MLIRTFAVAAGLCLGSGAAIAQDAAQPQPQTVASVKEKKVCRAVTPTGTIMPKQLCLTKAEWAEFNDRNERHNNMFRDNKNKGLKPDGL